MVLYGNTYGDWKVIGHDQGRNWLCQCQKCGATKSIQDYSLTHRTTQCKHTISNEDMIGRHYDEWKVIDIVSSTKVLCECSCGKRKEVNKYTLIHGKSTSCGHTMNQDRVMDLTGREFGSLKVLKYLGNQYWECECSCGNICKKHRNHLLDGRAHSCGHEKDTGFIDLTDKVFGMLTAKKYMGNKNWLCECECGNKKIIAGANLRNGSTISCGCAQRHISEEEIIEASKKFNEERGRLPFLNELAEYFNVNDSQMHYFIDTRGVRNCINNSFSSKAEREIAALFKDIPNKLLGSKKIITPYELDIYLPDYKLAIEYNGNYWHSELQKDSNYHRDKTMTCAKKGIQLIHIFEYEWDDPDKQRKITEMLMDKVRDTKKIYARDTVVREISTAECKEFIDENHLQGYTSSSIKIGCYYNDSLVGAITFGKPRFDSSMEYEIVRMCFKSGTTVVGGAQKLFKYFVDKYHPSSILTYVDIAKFTGNIYPKLGFKVQDITKPNYIWYNKITKDIKSRYQTQKSQLVKSGLGTESETEDAIMRRLKYVKIYDSGNLKLIWEASNVH